MFPLTRMQCREGPNVRLSVNCSTFRESLFHYQADELPAQERSALQDHLDACAECARRLEIEGAFLGVLKTRLQRVPTPPGLETRVRAALAHERAHGKASTPWFRTPWLAAAAASLLLALLLLPPFGKGTTGPGAVVRVEHDVMVVDRECDHAGRSLNEQRKCLLRHHLNALKLSDGRYLNIDLDQESHRAMLVDPAARGRRLHVVGNYYPGIRTLHVERADPLPGSL